MNIENDIFKRYYVDYDKLINYGFKYDNNVYFIEKMFFNDEFKAIIYVDMNGNVSGKVIEVQFNEEYTNIKTDMSGEFVSKVRELYKNILIDIRNCCFDIHYFISKQANRIALYIRDKYGCYPEFLWEKFPFYGVFRNKINYKWFAIIMNLDLSKLGNDSGEVEIINVKLNEDKIDKLLTRKGFYMAYHMNKKDWISIILNDTLSDEEIFSFIDESYYLIDEPERWIVPANPKYYDVINCFNHTDEIIWKQSSHIHVNDIVYIYVTSPYSKIMYQCKVLEEGIPYEYRDDNVSMDYVMRIKLIKDLKDKEYNLDYLKKFDINTIRGPRKISKDVSSKLK